VAEKTSRDQADDELDRPRRRRAGGVRKVHHAAGGPPDLLVDDAPDARLFRDTVSNVTPSAGLIGYEEAGDLIGDEE
jgi:hypothetical protein